MKLYCLYLTNSSLCFSVDPLTEKYPNFSPYAYTFNNPVNYTDPMGMEGEGVDFTEFNKNADAKNKLALREFVHTNDGRKFFRKIC